MKKQNLKQIIAGHIQIKSKDRIKNGRTYCPYTARCGKDCPDEIDCSIKKFYNKHPDYISYGVGSRL